MIFFFRLLSFLCRKTLFLFKIIPMKAKELVVKILSPFISKYLIALVAFVVWIVFFDDNNLRQHQKNLQELALLEEQVSFYKHKIEADKQKLYELQTNDANLEKFAREQFYMKRADEDTYVIVEEN
jgi:cell division protein DivIC